MHRSICTTLTTLMLGGLLASSVSAAGLSDIKGNWAEKSILKAVQQGYVSGYPEGTFKPGQAVQIDQFVKMLLMSLTTKLGDGRIDWSEDYYGQLNELQLQYLVDTYKTFDLNKIPTAGGWAKPYMQQADAMDILHLSDDYLARGSNQLLTREIAARILGGVLDNIEFTEEDNYAKLAAHSLKDFNSIDQGYQYHVGSVMLKGLMKGYPDGTFRPKQVITRAEAVVIIDKVLDKGVREPFKPDTTGYYPISFEDHGGEHVVMFNSQKSVELYHTVQSIAKEKPDTTTLYSTAVSLYKSKESRDGWLHMGIDSMSTKDPYIASFGISSIETYDIAYNLKADSSLYAVAIKEFVSAVFDDQASEFFSKSEAATKQLSGQRNARVDFKIGERSVEVRVDETGTIISFTINRG